MPNRFRVSRWKLADQRPPHRRLFQARRARVENEVQSHANGSLADRQLQAALELNHLIAEASAGQLDERELMEGALNVIGELSGAMGCSFVPVDEWQQPLPPFTYGQLPAPVLSAWSIHLASGHLRERCGACQVYHSTPGACPLHPAEVGAAMKVYCLPLEHSGSPVDHSFRDPRTGLPLGVLHLYLPEGQVLTPETHHFLERLLPDLVVTYQAARMRSQEAATMRHLSMLNDPESDFLISLHELMDSLIGGLEVDFTLLRLRPSAGVRPVAGERPNAGERQNGLHLRRGGSELLTEPDLFSLAEDALEAALRDGAAYSQPGRLPAWMAVRLPEPPARNAALAERSPEPQRGTRGADAGQHLQRRGERARGILLAGVDHPHTFHPRQRAILEAVAAQAALLVAFEQRFRALEYSVVIQERARLAREIHDGLAQTLAFLKLQAAQMQSQLAQGELERLAQVLKDSYQVLSDAYLDTRQAIDNLRLTPQDGLELWIERVVSEFERGSGIKVERSVQPLSRPVAPEVQAQLVRILQEALSNVRKHAHARRVRVSLCEEKGSLFLEVIDDGKGFEAADVPDVSRHGLRGMRERAEMIGADFNIVSQAHQGTTMRLALPVWTGKGQVA